ncbi:hypothetical protein BpHYR1_050134 [Brachionus plicatilis]|uniref:Uncharacterized protein n=1 Tax=Brachionus plicatilis TaxID=10195 RepID=A0A3M7RK53_BRAPC|nr:hypothetical protein BpHYR1_050134 [Brachionus plicatilis]
MLTNYNNKSSHLTLFLILSQNFEKFQNLTVNVNASIKAIFIIKENLHILFDKKFLSFFII